MMKKTLFCASDAGGANNLIPIIKWFQDNGIEYYVVGSKTTRLLFENSSISLDSRGMISVEEAREYLLEKKVSSLICGTTCYEVSERFLIKAARYLGIKSLVVLDEWFNYNLRFTSNGQDLDCLPDVICCQDGLSKELAIKEGIPEKILEITGSVYFSDMFNRNQDHKKKDNVVPEFLSNVDLPVITFLSETHSTDYGHDDKGGPLGSYIGYTEKTVREDIFNILKNLNFKCIVIEKLHPNDLNVYDELGDEHIKWKTVKDVDSSELFLNSDMVVGMRSVALLESVLFGCNTVSYQPNLKGEQVCTAVNLGHVQCCNEKTDLANWFRSSINGKKNISKREVLFIKENVPQRIYELI